MKFEVGEIALLRAGALIGIGPGGVIGSFTATGAEEVEITRVGPVWQLRQAFVPWWKRLFDNGLRTIEWDYEIDFDGRSAYALESALVKRKPPRPDESDDIPASIRDIFKPAVSA